MAALMKRFMAAGCEYCPACRYARNHPENWFGRFMAWHGNWCPSWKAWQEIYGIPGQGTGKAVETVGIDVGQGLT